MAPKPFPFPFSVGVDVCRISRIAALLRHKDVRNRWARRVFTRLEWPVICRRFERANRLEGHSVREAQKERQQSADVEKKPENDIWMLPDLSTQAEILGDDGVFQSAVADPRSRLGALAGFLAGRWAAKEAVIKAHHHRRLLMQEISIVNLRGKTQHDKKTVALIDPISDTIELSARVASIRGLRGFSSSSRELPVEPMMAPGGATEITNQKRTKTIQFNRRRKVRESDRQIAEMNISHDAEYTFAVCIAFDPPAPREAAKHFRDDGKEGAIHEPQWGDEGWFDHDHLIDNDDLESQSIDMPETGSNSSVEAEGDQVASKDVLRFH